MNGVNEVTHRGAVYTRTNVDKASVLHPTTCEGQRKIITYSNIILYLTIITKIKSVIKQLKERRWTIEDFYTLLA